MKEKLLSYFIEFARFNTQSNPNSNSYPSTQSQLEFVKSLYNKLKPFQGKINYKLDEKNHLIIEIPSNISEKVKTIGFIAHVDTSPDVPSCDINPKIIRNYDGKDIILDDKGEYILSTKTYPFLKNYIGQTLITTDGKSLLGADDKAGVAILFYLIEYLLNNPAIKHGTIKIAFTYDEEIGRGTDYFDVNSFGADYAYTIDGGEIGALEYENFNAAKAVCEFTGTNIHPGEAKNKMINSLEIFNEFHSLLPQNQKPEYTENYEGFIHLTKVEGTVEKTTAEYIIRDHDKKLFNHKKELFIYAKDFINQKYSKQIVNLSISDQYYNMKEIIDKHYYIIEQAIFAMEKAGVKPLIKPIRGGTDGAKLSFMGLPCPNLFTGGHNFHSRFEFIPLESMEKAFETILNIITNPIKN